MATAGAVRTGTTATGITLLNGGLGIALLDDRLDVFGKRPATRSQTDASRTGIGVATAGIIGTGTAATGVALLDGALHVLGHGQLARAAAVTTPAHVSVAAASVVMTAAARTLGVALGVDGVGSGMDHVVDGVLAQKVIDSGLVDVELRDFLVVLDDGAIMGQNGSFVGDWGC